MTDLPAEPPNRTALYWPETEETFATLLIRDDQAAEACGYDPAAAHWWEPNDETEPKTWAQVCALPFLGSLGDPIRLTVDGGTSG